MRWSDLLQDSPLTSTLNRRLITLSLRATDPAVARALATVTFCGQEVLSLPPGNPDALIAQRSSLPIGWQFRTAKPSAALTVFYLGISSDDQQGHADNEDR